MLEKYREYMLRCARCSNCKFVPHAVLKGYISMHLYARV